MGEEKELILKRSNTWVYSNPEGKSFIMGLASGDTDEDWSVNFDPDELLKLMIFISEYLQQIDNDTV